MKVMQGKIIGVKMSKTVIVEIQRFIAHALYKKRFKREKKYKADTNNFSVVVGDTVNIEQTRPISSEKYFKIVKIVKEKKK